MIQHKLEPVCNITSRIDELAFLLPACAQQIQLVQYIKYLGVVITLNPQL